VTWKRLIPLLLLLLTVIAAGNSPPAIQEIPVPTPVAVPVPPKVALLESPATRRSQGWRWDWEWSGARHVLDQLGVDYVVVNPQELESWHGRLLILPNIRNLSKETVDRIRALDAQVLATYMTSYRDSENNSWPGNNFALAKTLGVDFRSWIGSGEEASQLLLGPELGKGELPLGRGVAMMVEPRRGSRVLATWPGGEAAIVQAERGIYLGEDLFCPENSDSKPVLHLVAELLNRLQPGVAKLPTTTAFSPLPHPSGSVIPPVGREVRVGLGTLPSEALLRAPDKLFVNKKSGLKFHRWVKGAEVEVRGEPYLEVLHLRENGTYRWTAYRGTLSISPDGYLINRVDFEEYLAGVVPSEVPAYFPDESLKAMAVVARTYATKHLNRHQDFDVCDTVHCQVYSGLGRESESTNRAVANTTGELLTYDGAPVNALFHAVCGGATASPSEVWPGGGGQPYLRSTDDEQFCSEAGRYRWERRFTTGQLNQMLSKAVADFSTLKTLEVEERTESGRVKTLRVETPERVFRFSGDEIRWLFSGGKISTAGLESTRFSIERTEDGYRFDGGGWGHGVGLCQQGSCGRAKSGQSYTEILSHYYPETNIGSWSEPPRTAVQPTSSGP